jgi:hypothetical protein
MMQAIVGDSALQGYAGFLQRKAQEGADSGFDPVFMPDALFDFQASLVEWAVRKGRAALYEDTGLGKTVQELVWAENVHRHTNKPVLVLTPLAVAAQTVREAEKFGIDAVRAPIGIAGKGINVTNYERLHYFDPSDFGGVVCDESSILKSFDGARKSEITQFMRKVPYRLLATATAAPNDYVELGTSSEALGYLGHQDMLARFFKNDQNNSTSRGMYGQRVQWRFKGHGKQPFWRWVCSWARAARRPSDVGFDDARFVLPPLHEQLHIVESATCAPGMLFAMPAADLREQREERRRTITERCEKVGDLVNHDQPALVWCHLNDEGNLLEKLIPDAVQVSGSDSDEKKEEAFLGFANGDIRVLVTKPKIGAWGLNFQHCAHTTFFPSHSYEQYYQGVRRCYRFGQKREVHVDVIATEGEQKVLENLQRKAAQADAMFSNLVAEMNHAISLTQGSRFTEQQEMPSWLS